MPDFVLHQGATVKCMHAGEAQPVQSSQRVKASSQPIAVQPNAYTVSGCTLPPPPNGNGPCVTAQWLSAAVRLRAGGAPVLLKDSQAQCAPTGTGLNILMTQTRVKGT